MAQCVHVRKPPHPVCGVDTDSCSSGRVEDLRSLAATVADVPVNGDSLFLAYCFWTNALLSCRRPRQLHCLPTTSGFHFERIHTSPAQVEYLQVQADQPH